MTDEEIYQKINEVFQDVFDDDDLVVTADTTANDIEDWDSLAHINLIVAIEHAFGVKFNIGETIALENVGNMVSLIKDKI